MLPHRSVPLRLAVSALKQIATEATKAASALQETQPPQASNNIAPLRADPLGLKQGEALQILPRPGTARGQQEIVIAGKTYTGPFELGSATINYGSNTSENLLINFRCPTGSIRDGDALVFVDPGSNGWATFIRWYNPNDPTDGRFYLHIGADFWHGGGNCQWIVNGYYEVIDPTP